MQDHDETAKGKTRVLGLVGKEGMIVRAVETVETPKGDIASAKKKYPR